MLLSMTGYGRGDGQLNNGRVVVEIRSVNHRFCEITVRTPRALAGLETKVRERVQAVISRGKINVGISFDGSEAEVGRLRVNDNVARDYLRVLRDLEEKFDLSGSIEILRSSVLRDKRGPTPPRRQ